MKILIISSEIDKRSLAETILCDSLVVAFNENSIEHTFNHFDSDFDSIVLLNRSLINIAKKIKNQFKTPLFYLFFKSKAIENYTTDVTNIDFTFIFNDINLKIMYPHHYMSKEIELLFNFNADSSNQGCEDTDIYVSADERMHKDSALIKIIRPLNKLTKYKIEINSSNRSLSRIVNSNVVVSDSKKEIEERVVNTKIVIGAGYAILYAIKHKKPFIVIGERGYGGILNENNLVLQYKSFFQGRIGGKFDDPIPEKLLLEDIEVVNSSNKVADIFKKLLIEQSHNSAHIILAKMTELVEKSNQLKNDFYNADIIFNPDFTIIKGNGFYWLLNRFTREIIACINSDYYSAIEKCIEHSTPIKKIAITPQSTKIIKELLKSKVIISVLKEEDNPQI